ncbi:hypothetical protein BUALT_Bualt13G0118800 [Buddleja alternifolia]|uniref:RING-type domain-containing protein n=1 Tax=Buddleja alternifolia TaxID=168488 RepID=A0AAV6WNJ2_9LAMI|nr:hypothetical protein BUALT_Bualt13G0118800 [Buddleja alternifolia]
MVMEPGGGDDRTLLDVIYDGGGGAADSKTWQSFKDKLRRGNSGKGSTWTSSVTVPASDIPINNNNRSMMSRHSSMRINSDESTQHESGFLQNPSLAMERSSGRFDTDPSPLRRLQREENEIDNGEESDGDNNNLAKEETEQAAVEAAAPPAKTSLMALFGDYMMDDDEDDDDDEGGANGAEYNTCCVCMVKHKGVAFVLCGHSFCRLCSKEMWVQKDNCPLCNNYILEILDVF